MKPEIFTRTNFSQIVNRIYGACVDCPRRANNAILEAPRAGFGIFETPISTVYLDGNDSFGPYDPVQWRSQERLLACENPSPRGSYARYPNQCPESRRPFQHSGVLLQTNRLPAGNLEPIARHGE